MAARLRTVVAEADVSELTKSLELALFWAVETASARAEMLAMAEVCDRAAAQQTQGTDLSGATAFAKSWRRE